MAYAQGEGTVPSGSFTAPFLGCHGFYFMNIEEGPITFRLTVSGYWIEDKEIYRAVKGEVVTDIELKSHARFMSHDMLLTLGTASLVPLQQERPLAFNPRLANSGPHS